MWTLPPHSNRQHGNPVISEPLESRRLLSDVPSGFTDTTIATGLFSPTAMDIAPDGSGRIFVTEQTGAIKVIKNGQILPTHFATLNVTAFGEHGLLGITFDPNFASNQYVYVYYTTAGEPFRNRLSRFTANGDVAAGGETVLFNTDLLDSDNYFHDGGGLHFGPDGKLYISTGENQHPDNSQSLSNLQGKILRVNPDGSIPTDNPFYNSAIGDNRAIWAYGLRNPFTFAFQPGSGLLYINDVGNDLFEEINQGTPGANYGWPRQEGGSGTGQVGITDPIHYYDHGLGFAITGAAFYPASGTFPSQYQGKYFFSDIGGGWIKILDPGTKTRSNFASNVAAPVDLDVGPDGALYYLARQDPAVPNSNGFVGKIQTSTGAQAPQIVTDPASVSVGKSASASFSVIANGDGPLSYQWRRNGKNIPGATSANFTIDSTTLADNGAKIDVVVTNNSGSDTSAAATLTVIDNQPPLPRILTPIKGEAFFAGQTITYSGKAQDAEDGNMSGTRFTWHVDYFTGDIVRPFVQPTTGSRSGSFHIPTITPYTRSNVFYRITLSVTDLHGITAITTRDIAPRVSNVIVQTNIPGGRIMLDGQAANATTFNGVVGIQRQIGAEVSQTIDGKTYLFDRWSDGGDRVHEISTPAANATYTAVYVPAVSKGLKATYFNNKNFTGTQITRTDSTVSFDWGGDSPDPLIARDTFSARWSGKFQAPTDGDYTFTVVTDGVVRLRVNGQVVIDTLSSDSEVDSASGQIELTGGPGKKYPIILEYVHNTGDAHIQLGYATKTIVQQTIPRGMLFPPPGQSTKLRPLADAFVQGGKLADTNFGDDESLLVKTYKNEAFQRDTYLQFDLSDIQVITQVRLRVFGAISSVSNANVPIGVFNAGKSPWTESSLTYSNRPVIGTKQAEAIVSVHTVDQWWEFDLTNLFRAEKAAGRDVLTIILRNLAPSVATTVFASKEAASNGPELVVTS